MNEKRGLSPVIAVSLLIILAVIMAAIIFLYAKNYVGESIQKLGGPVEKACEKTNFEVDIIINPVGNKKTVNMNNKGNVAIYGINIKEKQEGSIRNIDTKYFGRSVSPGNSISEEFELKYNEGNQIIVIPILLGETETYRKVYICDIEYGIPANVI